MFHSKYLQGLHKGLGARLGDGTQVVDQVSFGHADSSVDEGQGAVSFVGDDVNFQILATVQLGWLSQAFIADFVQSLQKKQQRMNILIIVIITGNGSGALEIKLEGENFTF